MRLREQDLTRFYLFEKKESKSREGRITVSYDTPSYEFQGNIQPLSESNTAELYGVSIKYSFSVLVIPSDTPFTEGSRFGTGSEKPEYEIKAIQKWRGHWRIIAETVKGC